MWPLEAMLLEEHLISRPALDGSLLLLSLTQQWVGLSCMGTHRTSTLELTTARKEGSQEDFLEGRSLGLTQASLPATGPLEPISLRQQELASMSRLGVASMDRRQELVKAEFLILM